MNSLSSRLKIALLSAAISGLVLVGFGVVTWLMIYSMRIDALDREIRTLATRHPGLFAGRGNYERLASSFEFTFGADYTNRIILLIKDAAGRTRYRSPHWPGGIEMEGINPQSTLSGSQDTDGIQLTNDATVSSLMPEVASEAGGWRRGAGAGSGGPPPPVVFTRKPEFLTAVSGHTRWRIGVLANEEMTLIIGLNQEEIGHELNHLRGAFLIALPVSLFLVGLGGWVVAGRALRPLKVIADTAEHVTARGLDQRIPATGNSPEATRVIQVLNRMMDRLEASFRQATRFSADASHELKTPLAVMQGELENALQSAEPGSPEQQLFSNLLEETQRLKTITRSLLLLAQADAGRLPLALEPVDLSEELDGLIEDARVLAAEARLQFDAQVQPQVRINADRGLLHTTIFNLLSNAIKYNEPNGLVEIRLESGSDGIQLTLGNTGPGIAAADQSRVFERFYRSGQTTSPRIDGIGLGLSLAREIARAHGGDLELVESRPGWTRFNLTLPPSGA